MAPPWYGATHDLCDCRRSAVAAVELGDLTDVDAAAARRAPSTRGRGNWTRPLVWAGSLAGGPAGVDSSPHTVPTFAEYLDRVGVWAEPTDVRRMRRNTSPDVDPAAAVASADFPEDCVLKMGAEPPMAVTTFAGTADQSRSEAGHEGSVPAALPATGAALPPPRSVSHRVVGVSVLTICRGGGPQQSRVVTRGRTYPSASACQPPAPTSAGHRMLRPHPRRPRRPARRPQRSRRGLRPAARCRTGSGARRRVGLREASWHRR